MSPTVSLQFGPISFRYRLKFALYILLGKDFQIEMDVTE